MTHVTWVKIKKKHEIPGIFVSFFNLINISGDYLLTLANKVILDPSAGLDVPFPELWSSEQRGNVARPTRSTSTTPHDSSIFTKNIIQIPSGVLPNFSGEYMYRKCSQFSKTVAGIFIENSSSSMRFYCELTKNVWIFATFQRMFYIDPIYFKDWQYEDVTLATQCSANHLHHVIMLAQRWSGKYFTNFH